MNTTLRKSIAAALVLCLSVEPAIYAQPQVGIQLSAQRERPAFLQVEIPVELASIGEIYEAPAKMDPRLILHIQNAHGNSDAQYQIKKLLDYLYHAYGFKLLFVEGAAEKLDTEYLRLFSDRARNVELAESLVSQGELTGAELYLIDAPEDVEAVGIEQARLYRANYEAFKKIARARPAVDRFIQLGEMRLDAISSQIFSSETRRMLSEWRKFSAGRREFLPYVKALAADAKQFLSLDLEDIFSQVEWPQVTRLLVIQSMEISLDREAAAKEKSRLLEFLKARRVSSEIIHAIETLGEKPPTLALPLQDEGGGKGRGPKWGTAPLPRFLLERLVEEAGPQGFYFADYPAFSLWAGYLILQSELDPRSLFAEIEMLFEKILDALVQSQEDVGAHGRAPLLLGLIRDLELLRKLLHLELTRKDWERADYRREWIRPGVLVKRIVALQPSASRKNGDGSFFRYRKKEPSPFFRLFSTALRFYELARERETVFTSVIEHEMAKRKTEKAVLVTGGFHTDGLLEKFRASETSYGVLTPRLTEKVEDRSNYVSSMLQSRPTLFDLAHLELAEKMQKAQTLENLGISVRSEVRIVVDRFLETVKKIKGRDELRSVLANFDRSLYAGDRRVHLRHLRSEARREIYSLFMPQESYPLIFYPTPEEWGVELGNDQNRLPPPGVGFPGPPLRTRLGGSVLRRKRRRVRPPAEKKAGPSAIYGGSGGGINARRDAYDGRGNRQAAGRRLEESPQITPQYTVPRGDEYTSPAPLMFEKISSQKQSEGNRQPNRQNTNRDAMPLQEGYHNTPQNYGKGVRAKFNQILSSFLRQPPHRARLVIETLTFIARKIKSHISNIVNIILSIFQIVEQSDLRGRGRNNAAFSPAASSLAPARAEMRQGQEGVKRAEPPSMPDWLLAKEGLNISFPDLEYLLGGQGISPEIFKDRVKELTERAIHYFADRPERIREAWHYVSLHYPKVEGKLTVAPSIEDIQRDARTNMSRAMAGILLTAFQDPALTKFYPRTTGMNRREFLRGMSSALTALHGFLKRGLVGQAAEAGARRFFASRFDPLLKITSNRAISEMKELSFWEEYAYFGDKKDWSKITTVHDVLKDPELTAATNLFGFGDPYRVLSLEVLSRAHEKKVLPLLFGLIRKRYRHGDFTAAGFKMALNDSIAAAAASFFDEQLKKEGRVTEGQMRKFLEGLQDPGSPIFQNLMNDFGGMLEEIRRNVDFDELPKYLKKEAFQKEWQDAIEDEKDLEKWLEEDRLEKKKQSEALQEKERSHSLDPDEIWRPGSPLREMWRRRVQIQNPRTQIPYRGHRRSEMRPTVNPISGSVAKQTRRLAEKRLKVRVLLPVVTLVLGIGASFLTKGFESFPLPLLMIRGMQYVLGTAAEIGMVGVSNYVGQWRTFRNQASWSRAFRFAIVIQVAFWFWFFVKPVLRITLDDYGPVMMVAADTVISLFLHWIMLHLIYRFEGQSRKDIQKNIEDKYWPTYGANSLLWGITNLGIYSIPKDWAFTIPIISSVVAFSMGIFFTGYLYRTALTGRLVKFWGWAGLLAPVLSLTAIGGILGAREGSSTMILGALSGLLIGTSSIYPFARGYLRRSELRPPPDRRRAGPSNDANGISGSGVRSEIRAGDAKLLKLTIESREFKLLLVALLLSVDAKSAAEAVARLDGELSRDYLDGLYKNHFEKDYLMRQQLGQIANRLVQSREDLIRSTWHYPFKVENFERDLENAVQFIKKVTGKDYSNTKRSLPEEFLKIKTLQSPHSEMRETDETEFWRSLWQELSAINTFEELNGRIERIRQQIQDKDPHIPAAYFDIRDGLDPSFLKNLRLTPDSFSPSFENFLLRGRLRVLAWLRSERIPFQMVRTYQPPQKKVNFVDVNDSFNEETFALLVEANAHHDLNMVSVLPLSRELQFAGDGQTVWIRGGWFVARGQLIWAHRLKRPLQVHVYDVHEKRPLAEFTGAVADRLKRYGLRSSFSERDALMPRFGLKTEVYDVLEDLRSKIQIPKYEGMYFPQGTTAEQIHGDLIHSLQNIPGDSLVVKPDGGSRGQGLFVQERGKVNQEFAERVLQASGRLGLKRYLMEETIPLLPLKVNGREMAWGVRWVLSRDPEDRNRVKIPIRYVRLQPEYLNAQGEGRLRWTLEETFSHLGLSDQKKKGLIKEMDRQARIILRKIEKETGMKIPVLAVDFFIAPDFKIVFNEIGLDPGGHFWFSRLSAEEKKRFSPHAVLDPYRIPRLLAPARSETRLPDGGQVRADETQKIITGKEGQIRVRGAWDLRLLEEHEIEWGEGMTGNQKRNVIAALRRHQRNVQDQYVIFPADSTMKVRVERAGFLSRGSLDIQPGPRAVFSLKMASEDTAYKSLSHALDGSHIDKLSRYAIKFPQYRTYQEGKTQPPRPNVEKVSVSDEDLMLAPIESNPQLRDPLPPHPLTRSYSSDLQGVKQAIQDSIEWLIKEGYPYPQILRDYQSQISKGVEMPTEKTSLFSKGFSHETRLDIHEINVGLLSRLINEMRQLQSPDAPLLFVETICAPLVREAWGTWLGMRHVEDQIKYAKKQKVIFKSKRKEFHLEDTLQWPGPNLTVYFNHTENDILDLQSTSIGFEVFEALREREFLSWAQERGLYHPDRIDRLLEEEAGEHLKMLSDDYRSQIQPQGNLLNILEVQLHGKILNVLILSLSREGGVKWHEEVDITYGLLEFERGRIRHARLLNHVKATVKAIKERGLLPPDLPLNEHVFLESARYLLPYVLPKLKRWQASMPARSEMRGVELDVEKIGGPQDELLRTYLSKIVHSEMDVCDMGCATGNRALSYIRKIRSLDAVDIHAPTLQRAERKFEFLSPEIQGRARIVESDLFKEAKLHGKKYDLIVFSPPRVNEVVPADPETDPDFLRIIEDPDFKLMASFLKQGRQHLKPGGKIILGYGDEDGMDENGHVFFGGQGTLTNIAKRYGLRTRLVERHPQLSFGIYALEYHPSFRPRRQRLPASPRSEMRPAEWLAPSRGVSRDSFDKLRTKLRTGGRENSPGGFDRGQPFLKLPEVILGGNGREDFSDKGHLFLKSNNSNFQPVHFDYKIVYFFLEALKPITYIVESFTEGAKLTAHIFEQNPRLSLNGIFVAFLGFHLFDSLKGIEIYALPSIVSSILLTILYYVNQYLYYIQIENSLPKSVPSLLSPRSFRRLFPRPIRPQPSYRRSNGARSEVRGSLEGFEARVDDLAEKALDELAEKYGKRSIYYRAVDAFSSEHVKRILVRPDQAAALSKRRRTSGELSSRPSSWILPEVIEKEGVRSFHPVIYIDQEWWELLLDAARQDPFYRDLLLAEMIRHGASLRDLRRRPGLYFRSVDLLKTHSALLRKEPFDWNDENILLIKKIAAHRVEIDMAGNRALLGFVGERYTLETVQRKAALTTNSALRSMIDRYVQELSAITPFGDRKEKEARLRLLILETTISVYLPRLVQLIRQILDKEGAFDFLGDPYFNGEIQAAFELTEALTLEKRNPERPADYWSHAFFWKKVEKANPGMFEKVKRLIGIYPDSPAQPLIEGKDFDAKAGRTFVLNLAQPVTYRGQIFKTLILKGPAFEKRTEGQTFDIMKRHSSQFQRSIAQQGKGHIEFNDDGSAYFKPVPDQRLDALSYENAEREHRMGRHGFRRIPEVVNVLPVMLARYREERGSQDEPLGVVVLASPKRIEPADDFEKLSELILEKDSGDWEWRTDRLLRVLVRLGISKTMTPETYAYAFRSYARKYGHTLRRFHDSGYTHGNPHPDNVVHGFSLDETEKGRQMRLGRGTLRDFSDTRFKLDMTREQAFGYQVQDLNYILIMILTSDYFGPYLQMIYLRDFFEGYLGKEAAGRLLGSIDQNLEFLFRYFTVKEPYGQGEIANQWRPKHEQELDAIFPGWRSYLEYFGRMNQLSRSMNHRISEAQNSRQKLAWQDDPLLRAVRDVFEKSWPASRSEMRPAEWLAPSRGVSRDPFDKLRTKLRTGEARLFRSEMRGENTQREDMEIDPQMGRIVAPHILIHTDAFQTVVGYVRDNESRRTLSGVDFFDEIIRGERRFRADKIKRMWDNFIMGVWRKGSRFEDPSRQEAVIEQDSHYLLKVALALQTVLSGKGYENLDALINWMAKKPESFKRSLRNAGNFVGLIIHDRLLKPEYRKNVEALIHHEVLHSRMYEGAQDERAILEQGFKVFVERGGMPVLEKLFNSNDWPIYAKKVQAARQGDYSFFDEFWAQVFYPLLPHSEAQDEFFEKVEEFKADPEFSGPFSLMEKLKKESDERVEREFLPVIQREADAAARSVDQTKQEIRLMIPGIGFVSARSAQALVEFLRKDEYVRLGFGAMTMGGEQVLITRQSGGSRYSVTINLEDMAGSNQKLNDSLPPESPKTVAVTGPEALDATHSDDIERRSASLYDQIEAKLSIPNLRALGPSYLIHFLDDLFEQTGQILDKQGRVKTVHILAQDYMHRRASVTGIPASELGPLSHRFVQSFPQLADLRNDPSFLSLATAFYAQFFFEAFHDRHQKAMKALGSQVGLEALVDTSVELAYQLLPRTDKILTPRVSMLDNLRKYRSKNQGVMDLGTGLAGFHLMTAWPLVGRHSDEPLILVDSNPQVAEVLTQYARLAKSSTDVIRDPVTPENIQTLLNQKRPKLISAAFFLRHQKEPYELMRRIAWWARRNHAGIILVDTVDTGHSGVGVDFKRLKQIFSENGMAVQEAPFEKSKVTLLFASPPRSEMRPAEWLAPSRGVSRDPFDKLRTKLRTGEARLFRSEMRGSEGEKESIFDSATEEFKVLLIAFLHWLDTDVSRTKALELMPRYGPLLSHDLRAVVNALYFDTNSRVSLWKKSGPGFVFTTWLLPRRGLEAAVRKYVQGLNHVGLERHLEYVQLVAKKNWGRDYSPAIQRILSPSSRSEVRAKDFRKPIGRKVEEKSEDLPLPLRKDLPHQQGLPGVIEAVQQTIDWLIAQGYERPGVLRYYRNAASHAREVTASEAEEGVHFAKFRNPYDPLQNKLIFNSSLIQPQLRAMRDLGSLDYFVENFASVIVREAWGLWSYQWSYPEDIESDRLGTELLRKKIHEWPELDRFLFEYESQIQWLMAVGLAVEFYEAWKKWEFLDWAQKKKLYQPWNVEKALARFKKPLYLSLKRKRQVEMLNTRGERAALLDLELRNLSALTLSLVEKKVRMDLKRTGHYYFLLTEFSRFEKSNGSQGIDPKIRVIAKRLAELDGLRGIGRDAALDRENDDLIEQLLRTSYRKSAERLLPEIKKLITEWEKRDLGQQPVAAPRSEIRAEKQGRGKREEVRGLRGKDIRERKNVAKFNAPDVSRADPSSPSRQSTKPFQEWWRTPSTTQFRYSLVGSSSSKPKGISNDDDKKDTATYEQGQVKSFRADPAAENQASGNQIGGVHQDFFSQVDLFDVKHRNAPSNGSENRVANDSANVKQYYHNSNAKKSSSNLSHSRSAERLGSLSARPAPARVYPERTRQDLWRASLRQKSRTDPPKNQWRGRAEVRGRNPQYPGDEHFKALLEKHQARQEAIAGELGVNQATIFRWIAGRGFSELAEQLRSRRSELRVGSLSARDMVSLITRGIIPLIPTADAAEIRSEVSRVAGQIERMNVPESLRLLKRAAAKRSIAASDRPGTLVILRKKMLTDEEREGIEAQLALNRDQKISVVVVEDEPSPQPSPWQGEGRFVVQRVSKAGVLKALTRIANKIHPGKNSDAAAGRPYFVLLLEEGTSDYIKEGRLNGALVITSDGSAGVKAQTARNFVAGTVSKHLGNYAALDEKTRLALLYNDEGLPYGFNPEGLTALEASLAALFAARASERSA